MLQRWSPFTDIDRVWDEMDRLLGEGFPRVRPSGRGGTFRPAMDLYEKGEELIFKAVIPGARPEDIELSVEQNTLTIRGRFGYAMNPDEAKNTTWYRREIGTGQFAESLTLPMPIDSEQAEAQFEDGILTLRLPKAEQARTRRIPVKSPNMIEGNSQQQS